jgi:hypothetical protein
MTEALTLKQVLETENYDPMNIDISEFKRMSELMPKDGNIDLANAAVLATMYLRAADRCSEIVSSLIWRAGKAKSEKTTIRQKLYLLAIEEGHKTINDKVAYAESHEDFIKASDILVQTEAVKKWFEEKHKWFLESHRYMKAKLKAENQHMSSSGFSETSAVDEDGKFGEKLW